MPLSRTLALEAQTMPRGRAGKPSLQAGPRTSGVRSDRPRNRRALTALTVAIATTLSLATAPAAEAAQSFCSETGDFCTSVAKRKGVRQLSIGTFAHRGKVKICVQAGSTDPVCKTRTLKSTKGLYGASIKWSTNFPRTPKGTRKVTFSIDGSRLGPTLTFKAN